MEKRKELILDTIINEHIKTGAPVGSGVLVEKYKLNVSPATVRNDMAALEDQGFIHQPHTSAGRVPTEKAYEYYLDRLKTEKSENSYTKEFSAILKTKDEQNLKEAAKQLAQISGNAVFWAFHRHNVYYTGISNLFQQPEFSQLNIIHDMSVIIDRIDEIVNELFEKLSQGEHIMIGSQNPFGDYCASVLAKYQLAEYTGIFGIIGPMRMDYKKNISLIKEINHQISA